MVADYKDWGVIYKLYSIVKNEIVPGFKPKRAACLKQTARYQIFFTSEPWKLINQRLAKHP